MNFVDFFYMAIIVGFLAVPVKPDFSFTSIITFIPNKLGKLKEYAECGFVECCTDDYVTPDIKKLDEILSQNLYGQEIAHQVVINALRGHLTTSNPPKALSMSFHGPPGTGKTYMSQMIAKFLYKKGDQSMFYHLFNGRNDFPLQEKVDDYKEDLYKIIVKSLEKCERSMFVFDEVDKMPEGLLNVLVPFLDYNAKITSWRFTGSTVNTKKAIYIFLSNTASVRIIQHLLNLWEEGRQRAMTKLEDFENIISVGAFNERGGFHHSDAIDSSVIDHYVPFLPLEETHVSKCLGKAFQDRGVNPTKEMLEKGMSHVIFGPSPHNLFAVAGCKRLEQKVATIIYADGGERTEF